MMPTREEARAAIDAYVDDRHDDAVEALKALVAVPSDNPPGDCAAHAERAAEWLSGLGLTVERHPVPEALVRENGMTSATNLVVRESFGTGPVIALNAHGDVVPPGDGWTADPYGGEIRDGWMMGRGVATSKSDFVSYAHALLALKATGAPLKGGVELHFTYDEEAGGAIGPGWLLEQGISRPDYAVCAGFSYSVVSAHNGCLHLEVEVRGVSAHAAAPHTGRDALQAANAIPLRSLRRGRRVRGASLLLRRHYQPDAGGRADLGRHQHERGARSRDLPSRPPPDPGGER